MSLIHNSIELTLYVPPSPTARDIIRAYARDIARQAESAEESILDAELAVANAERIAISTRERAARLRTQHAALLQELKLLGEVEFVFPEKFEV